MKKISLIILFVLGGISTIIAQEATIKGIVIDENTKEPLFGVNVVEKGTTNGSSTGIDGDFTVKVKAGTIVLEVSYLGYEKKEEKVTIAAGETKTIRIGIHEEISLLETTVISASKFEKKLGEETVSLDVVKPSFMENQNLVTIDNAIERNPGVNVIDGQVNIRGGSGYSYGAGSRVSVLLDDLPIMQADAGRPNWTSIPTENIGQIEIIKGAASALYGSSAMNGIVNVRTAYPTNEPLTKISVWATQYANPNTQNGERGDWWNMNPEELYDASQSEILVNKSYPNALDSSIVNYNFANKKRIIRPYETGISVGHRQKFGKFDLVLGAQGVSSSSIRYGDFNNYGRVSIQTRYRVNEHTNFGINGNVQGGKNGTFFLWNDNDGVNKYLPASLVGDPTTSKILRVTIDPFFNISNDKGSKHKILARWYKVDNNNTNDQGNFSNFYYGEYQYQKRWEAINLTLTTGGVGSYTNVRAPLYAEASGNDRFSAKNFAAYIQLDKKFFDKLNVSLGGRVENNKISGSESETKPVLRAGINYQPADYTYIRASFGQGYRFPTIAEKFINTSLGGAAAIVPNLDLKSETGMSAEIGVKQGLKIGQFSAFVDLAGFFNEYRNMMEFNPDIDLANELGYTAVFQSKNVGNTRIWGAEISLQGEGKIAKKFPTTAVLGYTFISPKYIDWEENASKTSITTFNVLKYRFRHTFTGSWDVSFPVGSGKIDLGTSFQYFSFMENVDAAFTVLIRGYNDYRDSRLKPNGDKTKPGAYKGDAIVDFRGGYTFVRGKNEYKISAIVKNATNREYALRPGLVDDPLSYTLRLDLKF